MTKASLLADKAEMLEIIRNTKNISDPVIARMKSVEFGAVLITINIPPTANSIMKFAFC